MPKHVVIRLENALGGPARVVEITAVLDAEAHHLQLPSALVRRLNLAVTPDVRTVKTPDGQRSQCRYVGPVLIQAGQARCFAGAVEFGEEVVLGTIPLTHLGLMIDSITGGLVADPSTAYVGGLSACLG